MTDWKTRTHDIDIHLYVKMQKDREIRERTTSARQFCWYVGEIWVNHAFWSKQILTYLFHPEQRINGLFLGVLASLRDFLTWWCTTALRTGFATFLCARETRINVKLKAPNLTFKINNAICVQGILYQLDLENEGWHGSSGFLSVEMWQNMAKCLFGYCLCADMRIATFNGYLHTGLDPAKVTGLGVDPTRIAYLFWNLRRFDAETSQSPSSAQKKITLRRVCTYVHIGL